MRQLRLIRHIDAWENVIGKKHNEKIEKESLKVIHTCLEV